MFRLNDSPYVSLVVLVLVAVTPPTLLAQELDCEQIISRVGAQATKGDRGYRIRGTRETSTARCEGFYSIDQSLDIEDEFALISYSLEGSTRLTDELVGNLSLPASFPDEWASARLVVTPMRSHDRYRMDAVLTKDQFLLWPVGEVVAGFLAETNELGMYAVANLETSKVFVPVVFAANNVDKKTSQERYRVTIRSRNDVDQLFYQYLDKDTDCQSAESLTEPLQIEKDDRSGRTAHIRPLVANYEQVTVRLIFSRLNRSWKTQCFPILLGETN